VPFGLNVDGREDVVYNGAPNQLYGWGANPNLGAIQPNVQPFQAWQPKFIQHYLTTSACLGLTTYDTSGNSHAPSQTGTQYMQSVADFIAIMQGQGYTVGIGIRNNCPDIVIGGRAYPGYPNNQNCILDYKYGIQVAQLFAEWFGVPNGTATSTYGPINYGGVAFTVYNEPTIGGNGNFSGGIYIGSGGITDATIWGICLGSNVGGTNYQQYKLYQCPDVTQGTGGGTIGSGSSVQLANGYYQVCDCQTFMNTVRANGGNNVILLNCSGYTSPYDNPYGGYVFLNNNPGYLPVDPLVAQGYPAQMAMTWHVYSNNVSAPGSGTGGGLWTEFANLKNINLARIVTEIGDPSNGSTWSQDAGSWGKTNGIGTVWWRFNPSYSAYNNNLIGSATGTGNPIASYGTTVYGMMPNGLLG
jgi:hypothetical protein